MEVPSPTSMKLRIAFSLIGFFVGLSILFCFGLVYHNWNCAVWGLASGVFAGVTFFVHHQFMKNGWQDSGAKEFLRVLMLMGCFVQLAGVCGFVAYISIAATEGQALTPDGRGFYVTAVWCWMTWKWGFGLFYYSRSYRRLAGGYEEIVSEDIVNAEKAKSYD